MGYIVTQSSFVPEKPCLPLLCETVLLHVTCCLVPYCCSIRTLSFCCTLHIKSAGVTVTVHTGEVASSKCQLLFTAFFTLIVKRWLLLSGRSLIFISETCSFSLSPGRKRREYFVSTHPPYPYHGGNHGMALLRDPSSPH